MSTLQLANLAAYGVQIGVLVAVAGGAAALLRLRQPKLMLAFWRLLLLLCLLFPLLQPWQTLTTTLPQQTVWGSAVIDARGVASPSPGSIASVAAAVLLGGILLRFAWLAMGLWRLRRCTHAAIPAPPLESLTFLQEGLNISARFLVTDSVTGPVTFGLRSPTILLPALFLEMAPRQQETIACHELLHVKRHDWRSHLLEECVRGVFWFHPAIWWLLEKIQLTREQVVDEQVIHRTHQRRAYLEALLEMARQRALPFLPPATAFVRKAHLRARVAAITEEVPMSRLRSRLSAISLACALAVGGLGAVWSCSLQSPPEDGGGVQSQPQEIYSAHEEGVKSPRVITKVEPEYTEGARTAKLQGKAVVALEVWPDGKAHNLRVSESLDPGLDARAIEAIEQWRFEPGEKDGQPVKVKANVEVTFRLL